VKPALAAVALAAALICAPAARAATPVVVPNGVAACQWLKITVTAHMQDVLPEDTGLGARHSSKAPCYLLLTYTPNDPNDAESPPYGSYSGPVLCQIDGNGDWEMMTADPDAPLSATAFPDGNAVGIDGYMTFMNSSGDVIQGFGTHVLHIRSARQVERHPRCTERLQQRDRALEGVVLYAELAGGEPFEPAGDKGKQLPVVQLLVACGGADL